MNVVFKRDFWKKFIPRPLFYEVIQTLIFFAIIGLLFHDLGNFTNILNSFLLSFLYVFFMYPFANHALQVKNNRKYVLIIIIGLSTYLLLISPLVILRFICIFASILLFRTLTYHSRDKMRLYVFSLTLLMSICFFLIYKMVPFIWHLLNFLSDMYSRLISLLACNTIFLGTTAFGFRITIVFIIFSMTYSLLSFPRKYRIRVLLRTYVLLFLLNGIFGLSYLFFEGIQKIVSPILSFSPSHLIPFYILLLGFPLFLIFKNFDLNANLSVDQKLLKGLIIIFLCLSLFFLKANDLSRQGVSNIYFYNKGFLDFKIPQHNHYGQESWGMFGRLSSFLERRGHRIRIDSDLSAEILENTDILVLINLNEKLNSKDKERIWDFVKKGHSLLCLGDHTGMNGIREPLNDLLEPVKIKYNFDSAHYLGKSWKNDFDFLCHPITWHLQADEDTGIGIGASLNINYNSRPIIIAKYGFSDKGNPNDEANAYLGDRKYNLSEKLGDIVLVAEANLGKGKILVFGDTSSFQNFNISTNYIFLESVFHYLNPHLKKDSTKEGFFWSVIVLGIAFLSLVFILKKDKIFTPLLAIIFMILYILFTTLSLQQKFIPCFSPMENIAWIDDSHIERITFIGGKEEQIIDGLLANLLRNNYSPFILNIFTYPSLLKSSVVIAIAPSKPFTAKEIHFIHNYIKEGGIFLLSSGYYQSHSSKSILKYFGMSLMPIPLGPIGEDQNDQKLKFYNAWPIQISNIDTDALKVVCKYFDGKNTYPLIITKKVGKGQFILIGDSHFLCNINLESSSFYYKNNIDFLNHLLQGNR